jgi:hypothetical protein
MLVGCNAIKGTLLIFVVGIAMRIIRASSQDRVLRRSETPVENVARGVHILHLFLHSFPGP